MTPGGFTLGLPGSELPGSMQAIRPGDIYTTSPGPDGRVIYHLFRAEPVSYHTPNGWITGFRWVPLGDRHVPSAGSQPANPEFDVHLALENEKALRQWQRDEECWRKEEEKPFTESFAQRVQRLRETMPQPLCSPPCAGEDREPEYGGGAASYLTNKFGDTAIENEQSSYYARPPQTTYPLQRRGRSGYGDVTASGNVSLRTGVYSSKTRPAEPASRIPLHCSYIYAASDSGGSKTQAHPRDYYTNR